MVDEAPEPVIDEAALAAFDVIATPVLIFDRTTLRCLAVNESTAYDLDRSVEDLLEMSLVDLRPPEDMQTLKDAIATIAVPLSEAGRWRLRKGDGGSVDVSMRWRRVRFRGQPAVLATWRDVSSHHADDGSRGAVSRERSIRPERAEATARLYRALFEAAPGKLLVMTPGTYEIVAGSDAFFEATNSRKDEIIGLCLFEVFPDDPADPEADGVRNLTASLQRVERNRVPDVMAVQRHPIPQPASKGGGFEERFWSQINAPVLDSDGRLIYLIHRTEDVTELAQSETEDAMQPLEKSRRDLARDVLLRSQELGRVNIVLQEQAARLRTAEQLLDLGTWSYDMQTGEFEWSDRVRELCGIPADRPLPDFDAYVDLVHSEDRDAMVARYREFEQSGASQITFQHRLLRADGSVVHVKGVGERHRVDGREEVVGFVQDITEYVEATERLSYATGLIKMAGERAKLGGWRVDLDPTRIHWTDGTAAIHEEPAGKQPSLDEAFSYYAPEHRDLIADRFTTCAQEGVEFDEVLRLVTAKGNRIWVRAMGEPVRNPQGTIEAVQGGFQDVTEIVETRERVAAVSGQLRETLENMGDAFYMIDHEWKFSFVNKQAEILLQRRSEDLIGRGKWDEFPEAANTILKREYERVQNERIASHFELFYPPLDTWFNVSAHPAPNGIAVYFNDITEQRAREQQLHLLEAAVSRINDVVLITEAGPNKAPDGPRVVYVNEAFERMSGYSREEVLDATPRILQGPETDRAELARIREAVEQARPIRSEIVNYTKSGAPYWLELDIVPLEDSDGTLTHFVSVQRDVTERKRNEEAIRVRDERFRLLGSATNDVIWDMDISTGRIWWNDALSTVFGHAQDAVASLELLESLIHPDDRDGVGRSFREAIDGSDTRWVGEYRFMHADGSPRTVIDRGFIIRDSAGKAVRMLGSITDVTEQRELEARYRQAQKLEAVGQLTGGVAHDFNNLLTVILGNCELLSEDLTDPKLQSMVQMAVSASERGAELTGRLLAFSRRQPLDPRRLDLNRHVGEMEELLRRTLREDIDLHFVCDPDLHAVDADPAQLEAALLNLVLNARDAMPEGGRLTIETANVSLDEDYAMRQAEVRPGPYVKLSVTDSGAGMSPDVVACAFEPFFTTKDTGVGSGLGLSMVYGFVKQSGGHISIYSEPGHGTTVKLYLPWSDGETAIFEADSQSISVRGGSESILVVEDDDMVRKHFVTLLNDLGYCVRSAENGPRALELINCEEARFDLLLTDVIMPGGMNGRELAEAAKAAIPNLQVLFTSGYTENTIIHHGRLDAGAHLLAKPFRRQELAEKVRVALDTPDNY